jgi:glycosyltransferase involved in cell wall biosynthesis
MSMSFQHAVLLSFEGPDQYSLVGGLGTRVTELSAALAASGVATTLVFVGDPNMPAIERPADGLTYRRWCQWISAYHTANVYDGEWSKIPDYTGSVAPVVVDDIVRPAAERGESVLVIAEDWQTSWAAIELDRRLREAGLRESVTMMWNANNTYGFDSIDWPALKRAACVTTVSRYMKFELHARGIESLVIPNGIPDRILGGPPDDLVRATAAALAQRPLFVKVGRFDEDKRWMQAIEAFALLRAAHPGARLVTRGGREAYGDAIFARARELGLSVESVKVAPREPEPLLEALSAASADVVDIRSFVPEDLLFALYHVADAVLANSGKEPFGLVGLEVMASGGLAVTGATGEDYAEPFSNAVVCDTGDGRELFVYLEALLNNEQLARSIRAAGEATAERYRWSSVLELLASKAAYAHP